MTHLKNILFLSLISSLIIFINCNEDDNSTVDNTMIDGSTDPISYTLTMNTSEGGRVTPASGTYGENDSLELLGIPDSTYVFVNWTGSVSSTDNPLSITMDEDKSITAVFAKKQYNLNINVDGEGTVSEEIISNGRVEDYDLGTLVRLTANPSDGWDFVKWTGDFVSHKSEIEISIDQDISLTAEFTNLQSSFQYEKSLLLNGLGIVWGIEMLDSARLIFTEKTGQIYLHDQVGMHQIEGFPSEDVNSSGQGGLLDIKRHPNYINNGWIYTCFSKKNDSSDMSTLALARFQLNEYNIADIEIIFETSSLSTRNGHFGSRISFDSEYLYLSIGEGSPSIGGPTTPYDNAQNLNNEWGKIHRIYDDGTTPQSNPIFNENSPTSLFSIGHRNPQGLTYNPYLNEMYSSEHGPQGGDEINIIKSGLNYGWPNVSFGINYDGSDISEQSHEGYEQPVFYWDPSIATSDLIFLKDKRHGSWFKNLLVAGLKTGGIHRLKISDDKTTEELEFIPIGERVRDICEGLNGVFYISTDVGQIYQFTPK